MAFTCFGSLSSSSTSSAERLGESRLNPIRLFVNLNFTLSYLLNLRLRRNRESNQNRNLIIYRFYKLLFRSARF
jgi:hypothetical protein